MKTGPFLLAALGALTAACGGPSDSGLFDEGPTSVTSTTDGGLTDTGTPTSTNGSTTDGTATSGSSSGGASSTNGAASSESDSSTTSGTGGSVTGGVGGSGGTGAATGSGGAAASGGTGGSGASAGTGGDGGTGGSVVVTDIPVDGTITFQQTCEFSPCGGALDNADFEYVGACMEESALIDAVSSECASVELVDATGSIEGTVSFQDGEFDQDVTLYMSVNYSFPARCVTLSSCALLAVSLREVGSTTCQTAAGGGCRCTVDMETTAEAQGTYTTDEAQLTLRETTVDYCASDGLLRYTNSTDDYVYVLQASEL